MRYAPVRQGVWAQRLIISILLIVLATSGPLPHLQLPDPIMPPDFAFCIVAAWIIRRPDSVPLQIVAAAALLEEILLLLPLGLWSSAAVISAMFLRERVHGIQRSTFLFEWFLVSVTFLFAVFACGLLQLVLFIPPVPFQLILAEAVATAMAYPVVVVILNMIFGIRHMTPTELRLLRHPGE